MNRNIVRGFTLIELLVGISILATLAAAILVTLNPITQTEKANDAKRKSDLSQVQRAIEIYYQDTGQYPSSLPAWGSPWVVSSTTYIALLPKDPKGGKTYVYNSPPASNGQTYYLYASLDRQGKDPQACFKTGAVCTNATGLSCGSGICNFGLSSSNTTP